MKVFLMIMTLSFMDKNTLASESNLTQQLALKAAQSQKKLKNSDVANDMQRALEELKKSGITEKALREGKKLPEFSLVDSEGKKHSFKQIQNNKLTVINFFRGGWCPYCVIELREYEKLYPQIKALKAQLITISPESLTELRKTRDKNKLSFPMYRDPDNEAAKKLGIAFALPDYLDKRYKNWGIEVARSNESLKSELPLPGVYIIDKNGVIRFAFIDEDYKRRADPNHVLAKLRSLQKK